MAFNDKKIAKLSSASTNKFTFLGIIAGLSEILAPPSFYIMVHQHFQIFKGVRVFCVEAEVAWVFQRSDFWPKKLCSSESQNISLDPVTPVAFSGCRWLTATGCTQQRRQDDKKILPWSAKDEESSTTPYEARGRQQDADRRGTLHLCFMKRV